MNNDIFYEDSCYIIRVNGDDFTIYYKCEYVDGNPAPDLKIITLNRYNDITDFICHFIKKLEKENSSGTQ